MKFCHLFFAFFLAGAWHLLVIQAYSFRKIWQQILVTPWIKELSNMHIKTGGQWATHVQNCLMVCSLNSAVIFSNFFLYFLRLEKKFYYIKIEFKPLNSKKWRMSIAILPLIILYSGRFLSHFSDFEAPKQKLYTFSIFDQKIVCWLFKHLFLKNYTSFNNRSFFNYD